MQRPSLLCVENFKIDQKETPTPAFFCKFCEIFKNPFFMEHL